MLVLSVVALHLQEYDIGLFGTVDPSYIPCGVASVHYSRPVAKFDANKIGQYQRPSRGMSQKRSFWERITPII